MPLYFEKEEISTEARLRRDPPRGVVAPSFPRYSRGDPPATILLYLT